MHIPDTRARRQWLVTTGADRMRRLHNIAGEYGRPWWKKWAEALEHLTEVRTNWYQRYRE